MRVLRWKGLRRALPVLVVLCAAPVGASAAYAESPWWHLTSQSRPSYLQSGQATDEVEEVRVSNGEGVYLLASGEGIASGHYTFVSTEESLGEVQHQLENEVFEAGSVKGPTVKVTSVPASPGEEAYRVTFLGRFEAQWVAKMEGAPVMAGGPAVSVSEVTRGRPDGVIIVDATNLGDANANPAVQPVTVADTLPAGMKPVAIEAELNENLEIDLGQSNSPRLGCSLESLSCTFTGAPPAGATAEEQDLYPVFLAPYQQIQMRIAVRLSGASAGAVNAASITGGGAPEASVRRPLTVSSEPMPFGVSSYEIRPEEVGGGFATQAGSHPFQLTTTLTFNETYAGRPPAMAKDLHFELPPGLIGNPEPFPRCTLAQFDTEQVNRSPSGGFTSACPASTVVGVARVAVRGPAFKGYESQGSGSVDETLSAAVPLVNLEPQAGEPARFGFMVEPFAEQIPVYLDTSVRTGGDYGVTVDVSNITEEAEFLSSEVTFWGVPGDPRHDKQRNRGCLLGAYEESREGSGAECPQFESHSPPPLLSLPTSCTGPLLTAVESDSWVSPGVFGSAGSTVALPAMDGCNRLPFTPSIRVTPDGREGSKPSGLNVDVHVPQELVLNPTGLSESEVRDITVALPEGVAIDPAGGDGLEACSESLVGYGGHAESPFEPGVSNPVFPASLPGGPGVSVPLVPGTNFCPNASKIATVAIHTPLLPNALEGAVYLASQEANPFGSLIAMYLVAQDPVSGTVVVLPGVVHLTSSGQIVATFEDNPQLPFEDAELHFFGGERAPLTSPSRCGPYTTQAEYTPWSGAGAVDASSMFDVTSGPNGSACPGSSLPFSPSLTAGTTSIQAGGFSPFTMTMSREDGQQSLQAITLKMPEGLSGLLSGVELCPEPQADEGTCGPNSLIGETTVSVGLGGDPYTVKGGRVYITGPYGGAPFGLSIVNPAKAGPFDLEHTAASHPACDCLVVRAKIAVDPQTAALTITSDNTGPYKIPTILEGIPLQIKHVNVTVNRPGFTFNPTDCEKTQIGGSLDSAEGASQALSVPFQATNCATLGFAPKFAASTSSKVSRLDGTSLNVKLAYPRAAFGSQANIQQVKVELPKQLPSRLPTLQKACTAVQFHANPGGCPAASVVGHARATTPLVPVPLEGPAYFVSNGGEAFPNLIVVLQGYGVTIDLVGDTFISKAGVTSSTFKTVPDAPVGNFELNLPAGPYSALTGLGNLCKQKLVMPTEMLAQNGAAIHQNTKLAVTGCPKAAKVTHKHKQKTGKKAKKTSRRRGARGAKGGGARG
jgi:hypothetical protein